MRFIDSKLKYLLLPLVPISAIGLVELHDIATQEFTTVEPVKSVSVKEVVKPTPPPAPPTPVNTTRPAPPA